MIKLPCPPELWPAFSTLLDEALALPDEELARWFAALGPEHAAVRPYLAKVMATSSVALERPFARPVSLGEAVAGEFAKGQVVGGYLLEQRLGRGGMGEVWLASRQDKTPNRRVALKLPHSSLLAGIPRRRFERERDILAALSHPHIAQLYDAGVADSEHPYLAMEWVDGVSIVEHCAQEKLSIERRLELFLQILDAVGYAHGRLIAHRDLKPNNILVTREGQVKLLDFGIAKLLSSETGHGATELTQMGNCVATPAYAAPEQLAGEPVTAAVDLYALGVILFELLSGGRAFRETRRPSIDRAIVPRPSAQIQPGHAAAMAGLNNRQVRRLLTGDLDAIAVKALQADPAHRYQTAEAFALDIRNSRDHRPITARHISVTSLVLRFVRRHWLGVGLSSALALALVGGIAGVTWQEIRAERETRRATAIKDFLIGVFRASDPRIAADKPRGEITARELLDISAGRIETGFAQTPETQLELLGVTADIYRELDETKRSTALYARETQLARKYYGVGEAHTIDGLLGQAYNANVDGDTAAALRFLDQVDPLIRSAGLDNTVVRARWSMIRGEALAGNAAEVSKAESSLESAVALFSRVAPRDSFYPSALIDLGALALERSAFLTAAAYYRRAASAIATNAQSEGTLLYADSGLALALKNLGDFNGAAAAFADGTNVALRTYGRDSQSYWAIASDRAKFRYERGERQAALQDFADLVQALPLERAAFRNASVALEASQVLRKYGHCLAVDGQGARAVQMLERAHDLLQTSASHTSDPAHLLLDLGRAYEAGGQLQEARDAFMTAIGKMEKQHAPAAQMAGARERWARFLLSQGDLEAAYTQYMEVLRLSEGHRTEPAVLAETGLAAIALARNDVQDALQASEAAVAHLSQLEGYYDIRVEPYAWQIHAKALLLSGNVVNARGFASRSRDAVAKYYDPGSSQVREAEALMQRVAGNASLR
jgi:serine/threonine-protein kinase